MTKPDAYHPPAGGPIEAMAWAVVDTHTQEIAAREIDRSWFHTVASTDDEVVVPVPVTWIRTNFRCDFCLVEIIFGLGKHYYAALYRQLKTHITGGVHIRIEEPAL